MQLVGWWGILTAGQSKPICWYWKAPGTTWLPYHCDCDNGCCTVWSYTLKALRPWWCGLLVLCSNEGWICALFCLHPFAAGSSRVCWICFMIPSAQFDFYILRRHQSAGRWQLQEYGHLHSCSCTCSLAGFLCEVPCQFLIKIPTILDYRHQEGHKCEFAAAAAYDTGIVRWHGCSYSRW